MAERVQPSPAEDYAELKRLVADIDKQFELFEQQRAHKHGIATRTSLAKLTKVVKSLRKGIQMARNAVQ